MNKTIILALLSLPLHFAGAESSKNVQHIEVSITEEGLNPKSIDVKPGTTVVLDITRKTDSTCATSIQIPSQKIKKELPINETVSLNLGELKKGEIRFGCGMNMMESARISVK